MPGAGLDLHTLSKAPRFYVDTPLRAGGSCVLPEDAAHHATHVMRLRAGDAVTLFDGRGGEYPGRIASAEKLRIAVDVLEHRPLERESPLAVTLVQAVSAGDRMDFTVRKAVELGVARIQPVLATRSVARPKGTRADLRREHWQKVAIAACEQCGRNRVPPVLPLLMDAAAYRPEDDAAKKILLSPLAELRFSAACAGVQAGVILAAGPEAGFTAEEEAAFVYSGFVPARLGPRVLRTETAALAALAALSALRGDF
ncbi:MAG TPA: 16S rRNA (uracil(1498)-N(3))-methyltransferase [Burkholderiales bacterium]|nr:16S rRNA (uracil(1498)-N(3))-methyltransferase [Burkholderiales bacterium]